MCGIAGWVGQFERAQAANAVSEMLCALARRGPDGTGIEEWDEAVLGHRRLAIFDLSELGRQPMTSVDRKIAIVFNGAIYNFRELREQLVRKGFEFKSQTDTEVLLRGYEAWGLDKLVARIRGMFAFALWDESARKLFLVRDRLGVKPLLYVFRDGFIAFASTVRALRAGGFVDQINERALAEYLEFGFVTDESCIYSGASKVPAATIVEWYDGTLTSRVYWVAPTNDKTSYSPSFDEAVEETEKLLLSAVERRLFADVPVGALLSGGVDSSLLCWAIDRLGANVTAFTISTPGDPADEARDAQETAARLGIKHRVLELSAEAGPDLSELVTAYAEPFACASALGMLQVSKAVAPEATVLLTGDGGDDVFLGYPEHRNLWLAQRAARLLPSAATGIWLGTRQLFPRRGLLKRAGSFLDYTAGGLGAVACAHDGLPMYERTGMLGERFLGARVSQRDIAWTRASARNLLAEFLKYDRSTRFIGEYMTKVDGATMHHALEARSPFLDQELWEFVDALPFEIRLRGGRLKAILREIAARRIDQRTARGRKRGFNIPVNRWLAGRWSDALTEVLRDSLLEREGWIRSAPTLAQLEKSKRTGWAPNQLWYIFVLEAWLRRELGYKTPSKRPAVENDYYFISSGLQL